MNTSLRRTTVAALLLIGSLTGTTWAQQSTTKETGNTLTGGAEATTTDKGTPRGPALGNGQNTPQQSSGSSSTGNTLTGGAEGTTTDKGTPSGPAIGGGAPSPTSPAAACCRPQDNMDTKK